MDVVVGTHYHWSEVTDVLIAVPKIRPLSGYCRV